MVSFVIARFLLGMAEAGFFPGIAYFMTCWFPSRRRGRAMGVFFAVGASAGILVGPVSANLLRLDGWLGIAGWQWVFLAEGLPTLALAALCPLVLRDAPTDAEWLTVPEREWLQTKLRVEREAAIGGHLSTNRAIISSQLLMLTGIQLLVGFGVYAKAFFLPLILKTFGFSNLVVGYWTAVPALAGILGMILFSQSSDRTGERVWHLVVPLLIGGIALMFAGTAIGTNAPLTIAAFGLAAFGISGSAQDEPTAAPNRDAARDVDRRRAGTGVEEAVGRDGQASEHVDRTTTGVAVLDDPRVGSNFRSGDRPENAADPRDRDLGIGPGRNYRRTRSCTARTRE